MKKPDYVRLLPSIPVEPAAADEYWRRANQRNAEQDRQERAQVRADQASRLVAMGAPSRILAMENLDRTDAVIQLAHHMAAPGGRVVVLSGGTGVGKTVAASHLLLNHDTDRVWFSAASDLAKVSIYGDWPWKRARVAVLDDLGTEFADTKQSFQTRLDALVSHFEGSNKKRLIITTNLLKAPFRERYGVRVASRIRQCDGFISVNGPDLRGNP